jgi:hypothetical protein
MCMLATKNTQVKTNLNFIHLKSNFFHHIIYSHSRGVQYLSLKSILLFTFQTTRDMHENSARLHLTPTPEILGISIFVSINIALPFHPFAFRS